MKNEAVAILLILVFAFVAAPFLPAEDSIEPNTAVQELTSVKAAVIVCEGMIDDGLYKSICRRTQAAIDADAQYLIYEIDTYGGDLLVAFDISNYFLHEVNSKAHTVAYVSGKAISAGAMISVACEDIIMKEKTSIGDCAPIQIGGKLEGVQREKVETVTRAAFVNAAEANGYPEVLLKAMVTMQIEVYKIKNIETGEYEFFESVRLPRDPNKYDLDNKELFVEDSELLTLTASRAFEYGVARAVVEDRQSVVDFLAERDGVTFVGPPAILRTNWSEEMVRWINSPAVMGILVLLAMLAVYTELHTPGVGLPGLVAVICVVIIVGSKYLIGLANWVEVALFVVGVLLLLIELLVLPGFGIAGVSGIICIFAGLFGMLVRNPPDKVPWPQTEFDWQLFANGVLGLAIGFVGFVILAYLLSKYLPKCEFLSGLMLAPAAAKRGDEMEVVMTAPSEAAVPSVNVGDVGEVVSTLRPTGKVKFGDAIVDCVAQSEFLDKGSEVEIIEIHGNRVVVKKK